MASRRHRPREQGGPAPRNGIRERAGELVRLREELERTYAARDGSESADQAWGLAAERFGDATRTFYAPFTGLGRAIRVGERDAVDSAVGFLEADPWCFRSGYVKAELMSALANAPLGDDDKRRLQGVVVNRLKHREPRLLRPTGRLAANVWDDDLAREVDRLVAGGTETERADAEAVRHAVEHKRRSIAGAATSIYADFNNADPAGRLRLNTTGSLRDLERLPAGPVDGQAVTVLSEDLRVEGIMRFSVEEDIWVAEIDWNAIAEIP